MIKLTVENYKNDKYYSKVVKAMNDVLVHINFVSSIEVMQRMCILKKEHVDDWKKGRIPYLEKVITCNLSKANRILQLMRFHAHDLNMKPSVTTYTRKVKSKKIELRFSKSGTKKVEDTYSRHFIQIDNKKSAANKQSECIIGT